MAFGKPYLVDGWIFETTRWGFRATSVWTRWLLGVCFHWSEYHIGVEIYVGPIGVTITRYLGHFVIEDEFKEPDATNEYVVACDSSEKENPS